MPKLVLAMFTSLDGYVEGPGGQFIPPAWSDEVGRYWAEGNLRRAGRLLYGRVNFEFNRGVWQTAQMPHADLMNSLPKTVISSTLTGDPGWNGEVAEGSLPEAIARAKAQTTSGDLVALGGAGLAQSLMRGGLVDEYRIMVTPTLFGSGRRLFEDGRPHADLRLIDARTLDTGAMIVSYAAS